MRALHGGKNREGYLPVLGILSRMKIKLSALSASITSGMEEDQEALID
jgi:hypothetical protein